MMLICVSRIEFRLALRVTFLLQWMARYSGILNSGVPDIAVPKPLDTNVFRYSGIPPLYRTHPYIAASIRPLYRILQTVVAKPPRLLQTRANTQTHTTTSLYIMPCAVGELCNLADVELIAPNRRECEHECRGGCGGRLYGMCGEVEDTNSDNPNNRICHTPISKGSLSDPAKRKQGQNFLQPGTSKKHNPVRPVRRSPESGSTLGKNYRLPSFWNRRCRTRR